MSAPAGHRCEDKPVYLNRAAAEWALGEFVRIKGVYAPRMHAYRCRKCGRWHFGRRPDFARTYGRQPDRRRVTRRRTRERV